MKKIFLYYILITIGIIIFTILNIMSSDFSITLVSEKIEYNKTYNEAGDFKENSSLTENKSNFLEDTKAGLVGRVILNDEQKDFNKLLLKAIILFIMLGLITYYFINKSKS